MDPDADPAPDTDPALDADPAPDPALFVNYLQDANKK